MGEAPLLRRAGKGTAAVLLALAGMALCARASGFCATGPEPQSVFRCMAAAYADRDIRAYRELLADDFVYEIVGGVSCGLAEEVASAEGLFRAPEVRRMTLVVPEGYTISHAPEPDTWIIDGVLLKLLVEARQDGEDKEYEVTMTDSQFTVRWLSQPEPRYVISVWVYDPAKDEGNPE